MAFLALFAMASHAQNDPTNLNFENWNGNDVTLDISKYAAGLYLLKIDSANGTMEAKFVKE